jgi:hypothetical protein
VTKDSFRELMQRKTQNRKVEFEKYSNNLLDEYEVQGMNGINSNKGMNGINSNKDWWRVTKLELYNKRDFVYTIKRRNFIR